PTFLGAHEVPPEFRDRRADYVRLVCDDMIPTVARERLAVACDVFCEPGVFDLAETRTILEAAARHGLAVKLHADELDGSGGAELGAALGAASVDHLAAISEAGIRAVAASDTVAVLLPATLTFLGKHKHAPARRLVEAGAAVALATDFNPGSSPTVSLPLVMVLGVSQLGLRHAEVVTAGPGLALSPAFNPGSAPTVSLPLVMVLGVSQLGLRHAEVVTAVTVNAAAALGLAGDRGQIAPGFRADLVSYGVSDWREVAYWL